MTEQEKIEDRRRRREAFILSYFASCAARLTSEVLWRRKEEVHSLAAQMFDYVESMP